MYVHRNLWSYCVSANVCNCSTSGSHICMCCIEYLHHVQTKFCAEPDSLLLNVTRISNLSLTGWLQQVDCKGFLTGYCLFLSWLKTIPDCWVFLVFVSSVFLPTGFSWWLAAFTSWMHLLANIHRQTSLSPLLLFCLTGWLLLGHIAPNCL